ncbi:MAG: ATP-binding protein [Patescibacteria group bacterium]
MFRPRILTKTLQRAIKTFPAIVVTGPRQSGKTTLLRTLFGATHEFVSLEDPDTRIRAKEDPVGFLDAHQPPVLFDEIQYVPELLSFIKTRIDEHRIPGQWLFTGSQAFGLMQGVSESLAGRAAILTLFPFSYAERVGQAESAHDTAHWISALSSLPKQSHGNIPLAEWILRGGYPEIATNPHVDRQLWCGSYIATYLERDIRNLTNIGDLSQFERFVRLCATRTGTILNIVDLARDIGVSAPTVKRWISVLEAGGQVYLLYPYYRNIGKRLIKSPKIYFNDTALASYLLGIHHAETLLQNPHFGNLFETMVVSDLLKRFLHFGELPALYYFRTRDGLEIDALLETGGKLHLVEIKSAATILPKHAASLVRMRKELDGLTGTRAIISASKESYLVSEGVRNYSWVHALTL